MRQSSSLVTLLAATALAATGLAATGCKNIPGVGGKSKVDPNSCGNYAVSDAGRKLKAFLEATVALETESARVEAVVKESCAIMGRELQMPANALEGSTDAVCNKVIEALKAGMSASFKADAKLDIKYKPAVCTVNADVAARAAAACEAKAEADIGVTCNGTCNGTCDGTCRGTAGTGGSGGNCNGTCDGTCRGGCDGSADVNASAQCKAEAEVKASIDVECTEPELTVDASADAVLDTSKAELTLAAIRNGLPKMLSVQARLRPLQAAVVTWAKSARELGAAGADLAQSFQDQALCISGQIKGAVAAIGHIEASVSVSVSVSASASGSAGVQ
jgi:modification target Cys-rich repeat protein